MSQEHFSQRGHLPEPDIIKNTLKAVVQVVALKQGMLGNMSVLWTGSGTIVDPQGIVLTNCHVANPRAMGMPGPQADALGIALTHRSDEPPALTYLAEIAVQSPEIDLAVLKITRTLDGKQTRGLKLPYVPVGDSDELELGDMLAILGYPGIGGDTVTFTSGSVSGFTHQENLNVRRAWIKTDATIAGGNSGGAAIDHDGHLVGIPTQAAAGAGVSPVDARPVVDTNRDGRVDHRDTPMAIGGFINGLRPVNLAKPLLRKAGVKVSGGGLRAKMPMSAPVKSRITAPAGRGRSTRQKKGPVFSNLVFSQRVTPDGRPINPTDILPAGTRKICVTFEFEGMRSRTAWGMVWAVNGQTIVDEQGKWQDGPRGRKTVVLASEGPLPEGEYRLVLTVRNEVVAEGVAAVGRRVNDTDTEISGQVVDARTGRGIPNALVIALKPGVRVMDFVRRQNKSMAFTSARTDRQGRFTFPRQLPKGQAYGLVVVARGYRDLAVEGALRVSTMAPEQAQTSPIPLEPE